jgi:2-(1,2-epoxy-1,2-dihydrophenyl)acetyl-CoA isomerase
MSSKIDFELSGSVAILRLNDPATLNSLSLDMIEDMHDRIRTLDGAVRALLLTGAGTAFCSGANLAGGLVDFTSSNCDPGLVLETHINPLMLSFNTLGIPWVSAVRGAAAGVGAALALAADLIVAGENAYFLQAFRRIGLVPDGGSTYLLVKAIGRVRAMEMMLLGEKLPAAKALEWGLINRVVADEDVERTALELAKSLAAGPTRALGLIRNNAWLATHADMDVTMQAERSAQKRAGTSPDLREGVQAFLEKRPARFTGQ